MRKWVKLKAGKSKKVQKFYPLVYRDEVQDVSPSGRRRGFGSFVG
jgi:23S rRNA (cytosine1962-C5)-methyltransferase